MELLLHIREEDRSFRVAIKGEETKTRDKEICLEVDGVYGQTTQFPP